MILDRLAEILHRSNPWLHWWLETLLDHDAAREKTEAARGLLLGGS